MTGLEMHKLVAQAIRVRDMYVPEEDKKIITDLCDLVWNNEKYITEDWEGEE